MQIQYLTGQYYDIDSYSSNVSVALKNLGHDVRLISYTTAMEQNNFKCLLPNMSKYVDITLIDNANALESLISLSTDDTLFTNLISITEFLIPLTTYCFPKPIVLLNVGEKYLTDLASAIDVLHNQTRRCLDRTGHYNRTDYGWLLKNAEEELYALGMWEKLEDRFDPRSHFMTWTNDPSTPIIKCQLLSSCGYITIRSTVDECIKINKKEFCEIAKCWLEYKKGLIPTSILHQKTHLFPYILGLLLYVNS